MNGDFHYTFRGKNILYILYIIYQHKFAYAQTLQAYLHAFASVFTCINEKDTTAIYRTLMRSSISMNY